MHTCGHAKCPQAAQPSCMAQTRCTTCTRGWGWNTASTSVKAAGPSARWPAAAPAGQVAGSWFCLCHSTKVSALVTVLGAANSSSTGTHLGRCALLGQKALKHPGLCGGSAAPPPCLGPSLQKFLSRRSLDGRRKSGICACCSAHGLSKAVKDQAGLVGNLQSWRAALSAYPCCTDARRGWLSTRLTADLRCSGICQTWQQAEHGQTDGWLRLHKAVNTAMLCCLLQPHSHAVSIADGEWVGCAAARQPQGACTVWSRAESDLI